MAETKSGDLIAAHGDRVARVWKRTFRTVHPEPANALPLPTIVAQKRRPGTALVDVDYTVKDADNATVQTAALAFKNGGNSLSDVIPITSFADGTGNKLGANIATGQTNRFTWDVARDWSTDFGEVQLEMHAKDGRGLLNLDFIQIPATGNQTALKISRSPLTDNDFLSVWYWLIATGDQGIRFANGTITTADGSAGPVPGITAEYFENADFTGNSLSRIDQTPTTPNSGSDDPVEGIPFPARSIRWSGEFLPAQSGRYTFHPYSAIGKLKIIVGGNTTVEGIYNYSTPSFTVEAEAGVPLPIVLEISADPASWYGNARYLQFSISPPGSPTWPWESIAGYLQTASDLLASGVTTTRHGREFLFKKMGLREATAAEVLRAKEAGNPGAPINQWDPKLRVGPDERPAKINAYGFDTGGSGYWVVPVNQSN